MAEETLSLQSNGYLPPGIHQMSLEDFEDFFTQQIPDQNTRQLLFSGYKRMCSAMQAFSINNYRQWIGGSFTTSKTHPHDIDVVTFISMEELNNLPANIQNLLLENPKLIVSAFTGIYAKKKYFCDSYIIYIPPASNPLYNEYINQMMYWRGVWGFDRSHTPRGWIEITFGRGA